MFKLLGKNLNLGSKYYVMMQHHIQQVFLCVKSEVQYFELLLNFEYTIPLNSGIHWISIVIGFHEYKCFSENIQTEGHVPWIIYLYSSA